MKYLLHALGAGLLTTLLLSANNQVLTIDEAIEIALKHSPDIKNSQFDFKSAIERNKFQKGYYLPELNFELSGGRQSTDFKNQKKLNGTLLMGRLSASQLLYDFGKTSGRVDASSAQVNAYKATMHQSISTKILYIKARYYDALKMKSIIDVNHKNIKLQEGQLMRAKRYYDEGIKTIIDVSDAQVRLTQAKLDLSNSKYELKLRLALLEEAMGYTPYRSNYELYHKKIDLHNIADNIPKINTSISKLEAFAYEHRYELKSSKYLVESSKHLVESKKGEYLPTLMLRGDYMSQDVDKDFISSTPQKQWQANINMQWNLFSGKQTDASVQEAKISALKASSHVNEIRLLIKRQVVEASLGVRRTRDSVTLSQNITKASKKKYEQAKKRYENDLSDYIELQEAQQSYIKSLGELVSVYYNYYIAIAQLDFAIGK
jgi:outer membrane protein